MTQRKWGLAALIVAIGACAFAAADGDKPADTPGVVVDKDKRTITIDAKVSPRKFSDPRYMRADGTPYPLEVVACWPFEKPHQQKAHETAYTVECQPSDVAKAVESFGLKPGTPQNGGENYPDGPEVNIFVEAPTDSGDMKRYPIEKTMIDPKTGKSLGKQRWHFTGSALVQPDPNKVEKVFGADTTGTLICVFPVTDLTVFQAHQKFTDQHVVDLEIDKKLLPKEGTPV
ncbi:MAG TPA: YdjY domain-containing protein, partial [Gemmataceae bacterium]|nr:YdjY domain-containing protein [Gemmataceae bacterium]